MKRLAPLAFLFVTVVAVPSCVLVVGAGIGAGAMYALGEDSIELYIDHTLDSVYSAAQLHLEDVGEVKVEEMGVREAYIAARVEKADVDIYLTGVTENTTRLIVKARKWNAAAPDLELAQDLADLIAYRAK
jgi:hypothetical protein